jgi:hypothetical protein
MEEFASINRMRKTEKRPVEPAEVEEKGLPSCLGGGKQATQASISTALVSSFDAAEDGIRYNHIVHIVLPSVGDRRTKARSGSFHRLTRPHGYSCFAVTRLTTYPSEMIER